MFYDVFLVGGGVDNDKADLLKLSIMFYPKFKNLIHFLVKISYSGVPSRAFVATVVPILIHSMREVSTAELYICKTRLTQVKT